MFRSISWKPFWVEEGTNCRALILLRTHAGIWLVVSQGYVCVKGVFDQCTRRVGLCSLVEQGFSTAVSTTVQVGPGLAAAGATQSLAVPWPPEDRQMWEGAAQSPAPAGLRGCLCPTRDMMEVPSVFPLVTARTTMAPLALGGGPCCPGCSCGVRAVSSLQQRHSRAVGGFSCLYLAELRLQPSVPAPPPPLLPPLSQFAC